MSSPSLKDAALDELERLITEKMPITEHLEFELAADDQGRLRASAPLAGRTSKAVTSSL